MRLFIKNMVCNRCIMVVEAELEKFGLHPVRVELGEAEIKEELSPEEITALEKVLHGMGFEFMSDRKTRLVEQMKKAIIDLVYQQENLSKITLSEYLSREIGQDYSLLSNLFSESQGTTLNQFYILHKIERVKELLVYDQWSLSEIAAILDYSSVSHLSSQFKKVTGFTPSQFKNLKKTPRRSIDKL